MQPNTSASGAVNQAYTDLYDETRNAFLVQYPPQLVIALGLMGVVAFALVGFLGYQQGEPTPDNSVIFALFHEPWPLFGWFLLLIITLQWSIFRHETLRKQRIQSIAATIISAILVTILYLFQDELGPFLKDIGDAIGRLVPQLVTLSSKGLFLILLNFAIIAIFWIDTIRRWVRYARGESIAPQIDIGLRRASRPLNANPRKIEFSELVSGDLIAGTVLLLLLSVLFNNTVLNGIYHLFNATTSGCKAVDCSQIDLDQSIIYFPVSFLILALTAVVNGLAAMNAVNRTQLPANQMPDAVPNTGSGTTIGGTKGVVQTIIDTLIAAISRQIQNIFLNLALALRAAAWPVLVFVGVTGAAAAAKGIETYLHIFSDLHTCPSTCDKNGLIQQLLQKGLLPNVVGGLVAVLAIVFAASLLVYQLRVAENTLRFLGLIAFIVVLTFWIFSLALSGFDLLLFRFGLNNRWPFAQPGVTTVASFAALVIYGILLFVHNARVRRTGKGFMPTIGPATLRRQQEEQARLVTSSSASGNGSASKPESSPPTQPMN
jgi:hypothetical protein